MKTFDERLRYALDVRGISQHALARSTGISSGELSRMARGERGSRVSYVLVAKIARGLSVHLTWLGEGLGDAPRTDESAADPIPRRADAARICRDDGRIPEHAIERVLTEPVTVEALEMSTLAWIELMQYAARLPGSVAPPSPPVRSQARPRADNPPSTRRSSHTKK